LTFLSLSTFYKYLSILKLNRTAPSHRRKNHLTGIRAAAPLQILHADTTGVFTDDHQKAWVYLVQDNFSRAILQHIIAPACKARFVFETLTRVHEQYLAPAGIEDCRLITDDGSENYGPVKELLSNSRHPVIQHLVAQKDIECSNSMIEAANKQLKYRFLYHKHIPDFAALETYVQQAVDDHNNRPHHVLHGLTPLEVLNGQKPDPHVYTGQINKARAARLVENKKMSCCFSF
jgi:putative transposase